MASFNDSYALELDQDILRDGERGDLESSVLAGIEELQERAPSDSLITVRMNRVPEGYFADVHLVSSPLEFRLDAVANSPYVAFERAMIQARDRVLVWSEMKKL